MAPIVPEWPGLASDPLAERFPDFVESLRVQDGPVDEAGDWPEALWLTLTEFGASRWSLPESFGGETDREGLVRRYGVVAQGSLSAAFILSQFDAAVRRLGWARDRLRIREWLDEIAGGRAFATVAISQLTTSRRRGAAALVATERDGGHLLEGAMPWVTSAPRADLFVAGAVTADGRQLLVALPANRLGVAVRPAFPLAALQASCTAEVECRSAFVGDDEIIIGPAADVLVTPGQTGTGGLETSALALGQARAALVGLAGEVDHRVDLSEPFDALAEAWSECAASLLSAARGDADAPAPAAVRGQANALALRATQAYLTARKGSGFLRTDPAQRFARQALFFLVWSCPAPVAQAAIRDLAGLCDS
jgi:alkylation response protein AidB-like acyl-CoA dehydrogenase